MPILAKHSMVSLLTTLPMTRSCMLLWGPFKLGSIILFPKSFSFIVTMSHLSIWRGDTSWTKDMKNGWNTWKNFLMWSNTRKENPMLWLMLSLEGATSFLNLVHKFVVFITWESCINKMISFPLFFSNCQKKAQGSYYVSKG